MEKYYVCGKRENKTFFTLPMTKREAEHFINESGLSLEIIQVSCNDPLSHEWKIFWDKKETLQIEQLHCGKCSQDFFIPVKDWDLVEKMCCPYCREENDIADVQTFETVAEMEVKAS